ncbi:MAG: hypothetical protein HYT88_03695 [Candidatus Omnitrophica bacterium]|nr:hypothetical protein [Candidatus Omnitrophota bacterium]
MEHLFCLWKGHHWQRIRQWVRPDGSCRLLWRCQRCGLLRLTRGEVPERA